MIALNNVTFAISGTPLIHDTTLHVAAREAVCLCGPSGIGKTTLLEIAAGLTAPDSGTVALGSTRIGCAFQDDILVPWLTALDNLLLVMAKPTAHAKTGAGCWLDRFGLDPGMRPPRMSGGMRRRLSLARAFAVKPDILLLDEPFAFLDDQWQTTTAMLIEAHRLAGGAVLLVSHQERYLDAFQCRTISIDHSPITLTA
ncbi:MAG: ATP-binding cassette domain-containing protein [Pseudodesulfovibrio sp.]|uniref:ABC transporter related protein n=1 Tax=Pseudodesulfovibrio aespoeensis (strain ATCC 700646 / DSM 10631 / Aspo-2) TaxID=643562 RepID=E6VYE1_PSEA9|nr:MULTISPECIES: ATP-binding cassette domain-containing protein [Pseudodesulfovibrio]MBU4190986.1 ATP-binding cassette domain-containing protein [Pseudomonadota bacterium]ADU61599.1 ABC transporter related protein [Pseudodesulfovibrio aespoeensis Aspo-2]MBU4474467.1 ATP-binding cassette domain-containing protein [Pseudomonadota bacterium]MBU4516082.1 ATP-binding cassette domain-containing protein [Pseudomonadota bacterium]MBU4521952.1 ATP-binding cassette domain-containing protein [Pseudomonad